MTKIIFNGWEVGMKKISFTNLLKDKAGLSLSTAKDINDRVVGGEIVEIDIEDETIGKEILKQARELGVKGRIEI